MDALSIPPKTGMAIIQHGFTGSPYNIDFSLHEDVVVILLTARGTRREPQVVRFWNHLLNDEQRDFYRQAMSLRPGSEVADFNVMVTSSTQPLLQKDPVAA